jgi:ammonium transporter, Amt family
MLHLDYGNTGFMILCTSLVMLMTPRAGFFYGGLVGRKNVLAIMIQSFVSMGWTTVIWYALRILSVLQRRLARGHRQLPQRLFCGGRSEYAVAEPDTIPAFVFIAYQMMFAIITPALISGAFTNRVTFKAYMLFLTGWLTFVYFPFVHMVWGGGFLQQWGVKDFAGGIVVHNIAGRCGVGFGALRRASGGWRIAGRTAFRWLPWEPACCGLDGTASMRAAKCDVDSVTATAFLNTDVAASFAAVAWLLVAWFNEKKPKFLGLLTGAVAGLATITPAAGYVSPTTAVIIGMFPAWFATTRLR